MPKRLDSYNSFLFQNRAIEYELPARDTGWQYYKPMNVLNKYKVPQAPGNEYIYPNVDWGDVMLRDYAITYRANVNFTGGTNFAKYFGSFAYTHEGDLLNSEIEDPNRDYKTKYGYDRFNFRTNLDFNITKSTLFSVNLAGYMGIKDGTRVPYEHDLWRAFYDTPPSVFPVKHEDGTWGFTPYQQIFNNVALLNNGGVDKDRRTQVTTDFVLMQNLDFLLEGLSLQGSFSYDSELFSNSGNYGSGYLSKHIAEDGSVTYDPTKGVNEFDFVFRPNWKDPELIRSQDLSRSYRRMFYQIQANYARTFGLHDVAITALMNREEYAIGSMFPRYREDWVSRLTYNYDGRYLFETNGAYNGSEKFGPGYRFGFFPSIALGWLITNEQFMEPVSWLNKFKVRYSIGKIGSDNFDSPRWAYETNWGIDGGGNTYFGYPTPVTSPFTQYKQIVVGNPALQWEVATKQNLGFETGLWNNLFQLNLDLFKENRDKIFMSSSMRNIPAYFGAKPVAANLGETISHGYEVELLFRKNTKSGFNYYGTYNLTYAKDKVIYREDPQNLPWYMKSEGFQMGQTKTQITTGLIKNWDEVYATPKGESNVNYRLPGDAIILDFNGDGIINSYDNAPYGFPSNPQYTYNFMLGVDYKGFGAMLQFYGVFNTTRSNSLSSVTGRYPLSFDFIATDYWTPENLDARWKAPRVESTTANGNLNLLDGSFFRLKTAEISYTLDSRWIKQFSLSSLKLFVNGNNLFFWSDLPEDRERSFQGYPTMRRVNFGFSADF